MSTLIVAVRPGDASAVHALLTRFGAAVTPLPSEQSLCRLSAVMPQPRLHPALAALRRGIPSLQLCAIEQTPEPDDDDAPAQPVCAFRALTEPSPCGELAARRLYGFKTRTD